MDDISPNSSDYNPNWLSTIRTLSLLSATLLLGLYLGEQGYLRYVEPLLFQLTPSQVSRSFQRTTLPLSSDNGNSVRQLSWISSRPSGKQPSQKSEDLSARSGSNRR